MMSAELGIMNLFPGMRIDQNVVAAAQGMGKNIQRFLNMGNGFEDGMGQKTKLVVKRGYQMKQDLESILHDDVVSDNFGRPILKDGKYQIIKNRWNKFNDYKAKFYDAKDGTAFIHPNEVTTYRKTIQRFLRYQAPTPEVINGVPFWPEEDIGRGMMTYKYFKFNDVPAPGTSLSMEQKENTVVTTTDTDASLLGFFYDYHLTMPQKDASMSTNAIYQTEPRKQEAIIRELTKSLAVYQQYYKYRGTSVTALADLGLTGLVNDASVTNQTTIGNGGSLTTYGNIRSALASLVGTLTTAKRFPPYVFDISPGVFIQGIKNNNSTTGRTELEELWGMTDEKKNVLLSAIRINPFLIAGATETNTTAAMALFKIGEDDFKYAYSYPLEYYPMPQINLGVDGKLLFMGRTILEQASAVAYGGSLTVDVF